MEQVLSGLIGKCCLVYIDDILIFSRTLSIMLRNLDMVLERIKDEGGSIDFGKSKFLEEEIEFLGHKIGCNGIQAMDKDITAIRDY
jgi:Reverse transcriptase (RNA-dependent DNA polymerase)